MKNESFVIIPQELLQAHVSAVAICVYAALRSHLNRTTLRCNPRQTKIADETGKSLRTVSRAISELRRAGWLAVHREQSGCSYGLPAHADNGASHTPKLARPTRQNWRVETAVSINEPDVLNQRGATAAADKGRSSVQPRCRAAAAGSADAETSTNTGHRSDAAELVEALMPAHPEPGGPDRAVVEAEKILGRVPDAAAAIRRHHEAWRAHWATLDPHRFIPQLWRWLASGEWKYPPADRKGVQRETWAAQQKREAKQSDDEFYLHLAQEGLWDILRQYTSNVEVWREKVKIAG